MKHYAKNKESSHLQYCDVNYLYGQCRKSFQQPILSDSKIFLNLMKISQKAITKKVIRLKIEKVGKLVANLHDKTEYLMPNINLNQALNHGLV